MITNVNVGVHNFHAHVYDITMTFTAEWDNVILEMPSWTPGSYLIREYVRLVQNFSVLDESGEKLEFRKVTKNNYQIDCKKSNNIKVVYEVYAFELTVRTSYLDDRKGLIVPASMFFYQVDPISRETSKDQKITINFNLEEGWRQFSSLRKDGNSYFVDDFDELVDTPIALGIDEVLDIYEYDFDNNGQNVHNQLVLVGDKFEHDIEKFAKDLQKLQIESIRMFDELPYDRYVWLLYIVDSSGGGLEHKFSNCSITPRWNFTDPEKYPNILSLEAHEHFHTYNIKRIRPKQLGPFDYSNEVYTKLLWVAEGLTSFYDNVQLPRAGLISQEKYWEIISKDLQLLFKVYGRFVQSIEEASMDAWIRLYRPNENSLNSTVSYYLKGGIVGMMLDLEIRKQTNGTNSLDTFYKFMYRKYKENPLIGYEENEIQSLMETATKTKLDEFWNKYISGTVEVDIDNFLSIIGMKMKITNSKVPYTGIKFKSGSKVVSNVDYDSPAMKAGIYANDQIIAIQSFRAKDSWDKILKNSEGKELDIHLFRDGKLLSYKLTPSEPDMERIEIVQLEQVSDEQRKMKELFFNET